MELTSRAHVVRIGIFTWGFLIMNFSYGAQSDINCLRSIKDSLKDPLNSLYNWNFNNNTNGFICKFNGIDCWHENDDSVLNIKLSDMGLKGQFPRGVGDCKAVTGVDLSSNELNGTIPTDISKLLPFVTKLDLSDNSLSGTIPVNLANCSYLNVLKLDKNQLSGQLPLELGLLNRINTFSVTNNRLSGQVPQFKAGVVSADSYSGNPGLCGKPLPDCKGSSKKNNSAVIAAAAVGGVIVAALLVGVSLLFFCRRVVRKRDDDPDGNKWAKSLKGAKKIQVRQSQSLLKLHFEVFFLSGLWSTRVPIFNNYYYYLVLDSTFPELIQF